MNRMRPLGFDKKNGFKVLTFNDQINELFASGVPFVVVTVVDTSGSVPQDQGNKIVVTRSGLKFGTVGGGKVEARTIAEAQEMLLNACGGSVKMFLEVFNRCQWHIALFGAGHCAQALIGVLLNLNCRITCYDTRSQWLERMPPSDKLTTVVSSDLPAEIANLDGSQYVILMTMGHTTDMPILLQVLRQIEAKQFPYVGVIGSAAKAARLRRDIKEAGLAESLTNAFNCPMGLPVGSNDPQEIAISIVAQLLQVRDKLKEQVLVDEDVDDEQEEILRVAQGAEN
jgi:xanthine dehydrogenase accessory factor